MQPLIYDPAPDNMTAVNLREHLARFYSHTTTYEAFVAPQDQSKWHRALEPELERLLAKNKTIRVLELGAGRTTFAQTIHHRRPQIEYHVQDITTWNREYLLEVADGVHIGDIAQLEGGFDLIFSTFVLEHVPSPRHILDHVNRLLRVGGVHIIICPRYDVLGYICPSLRHYSRTKQLRLGLQVIYARVATLIDRKPRFVINTDPAVLHQPWFRDADAVHLVSKRDLICWHKQNGFSLRHLSLRRCPMRERALNWLITVHLAFEKTVG